MPALTNLIFGVTMATQEADELLTFNFFDHHQVNAVVMQVFKLVEALGGNLTVGGNGENTDIHEVALQNTPWALLFQFCVK